MFLTINNETTTANRTNPYRRLNGMNHVSKWLVFISVNVTMGTSGFTFLNVMHKMSNLL